MADNFVANAGSGGSTFAADDISGVLYPRAKTGWGADNSYQDVSLTAGLPVQPGTSTTWTVTGTGGTFPVTDSGGSLTIDAPVGTPAFVRLSDGTAAITTLPVSLASVPSHAVTNAGTFAVQAAQSGTWTVTGTGGSFPVTDSGGSLTVDAPVGTPVFVRLSDGANPVAVATEATLATVAENTGNTATLLAGTLDVAQTGTWTVQPGNTANTTAWLVTGTGGTFPVTDSGGSLTVDGTVSVSGLVPGVSATSLGKAEDAVAADGDTGVMMLAIRKDTAATTVGADGDYHPLEVDANGNLWVMAKLAAAQTLATVTTVTGVTTVATVTSLSQFAGNAINLGNGAVGTGTLRVTVGNDSTGILAGVTTVSTVTTVGTLTGGGVAHDGADSGNPIKTGAKATTALSGLTLVANADRTDLFAGVDGVLITRPHCNLEDIVSGNASNTDGTSTACIASSGAGVKTYLTTVILANSHASTNCTVDIKDGSTTKLTIPVPANGGAVVHLPVPLGGTAATAWNFDPSAAVTTITCSMIGFKSKV